MDHSGLRHVNPTKGYHDEEEREGKKEPAKGSHDEAACLKVQVGRANC